MATKDSRLAQIYRQELAKNKGLLGAFASAGGARIKEAVDLRQYLLPQSGISGAISQRMFGKAYRYSSGQPGVRTVGSGSTITDRVVSEKISRIDTNTKLTAKNTIVLPAMARDMNLMRMNMQKMVKISGGTPSTKADMFFKRAGDRESAYESQFKKSSGLVTPTTAAPTQTQNGGLFSGILEFLKMPLFNMFGSLVGMLVKGGLITAVIAGIGSLIRELVTDEDFRKSFTDTVDSVAKSIFGEDVWKNLAVGVAAAGAAFLALNAPLGGILGGLGGLVSFMSRFPAVFGVAAAGVAGWSVGSALNTAINTVRDATPEDWNKDYRKQDIEKFGEEVAPALTDPRFAKMSSKLAQNRLNAGTDEAEIAKLEEEIRARQSKPKLTKSDERYIERKQEQIQSHRDRIEKNQNLAKTPEPVQGQSASPTSPTKLEGFNYDSYAATIGQRESSGNYQAVNNLGYVGKYQMGSKALQDAGLIKPRTEQSKEAMSNPNNWTISGGLQAFLNNPDLQEKVMADYTKKNMTALKNLKVINDKSSSEEIAGALATSHLLGPGGAQKLINEGKEGQDAYGTKGSEYLALGKASQSGQIPSTPTLTASARELKPQTATDKEDSVFGEVSTMLAGVFKAIGETNNSIQSLAVASASSKQQQSASIASPYDKELYELLLGYHSDVATPLSS